MFQMSAIIIGISLGVAHAAEVNITTELESIEVTHNGEKVTIIRNQDTSNMVSSAYAKTSRNCPPFCIQPINLAPGVETVGELELLEYLERKEQGDDSILVIDSRTPDWVEKGTIPGAVNIPWPRLSPNAGADPFEIAEIFEEQFGAFEQEGFWNYSAAKTLVLFCNGMWLSLIHISEPTRHICLSRMPSSA